MIQTPQAHPIDLTAFSQTCPDPSVVTALLEELGLSLVFSMPSRGYLNCATMPAQFHYRDRYGTEVVYLAGRDHPDGAGNKYPNHVSRWWLYSGSSQDAYSLVVQTLSAAFGIQWPTQGSHKS